MPEAVEFFNSIVYSIKLNGSNDFQWGKMKLEYSYVDRI